MVDPDGDVNHVRRDRRAVAAADAGAGLAGGDDFRAQGVIFEPLQSVERLRRFADDPAVLGDERHAAGEHAAEALRLPGQRHGIAAGRQ
jgi:hypothetical protein